MRRICLLAAAALLLTAPSVYAQEGPSTEEDTVTVTGSRIVRQDFEAISPVTTVGSENLERSRRVYWQSDSDQTSRRAVTRDSNGASSVRVIRACEISLTLDGDCTV